MTDIMETNAYRSRQSERTKLVLKFVYETIENHPGLGIRRSVLISKANQKGYLENEVQRSVEALVEDGLIIAERLKKDKRVEIYYTAICTSCFLGGSC